MQPGTVSHSSQRQALYRAWARANAKERHRQVPDGAVSTVHTALGLGLLWALPECEPLPPTTSAFLTDLRQQEGGVNTVQQASITTTPLLKREATQCV